MAVLTEEMLRRMLRKTGSKTMTIEDNVLLTPSAREFVKAHDLHLKKEDVPEQKPLEEKEELNFHDLYKLYEGPGYVKDQPFYMAEIAPKVLISKDHPRYIFLQKFDLCLAQILIDLKDLPDKDRIIKEGLEELYYSLMDLKERLDQDLPFKAFTFLGMTEKDLDEQLEKRKDEGQAPFRAIGPGSKKTSIRLFRLHTLLKELESFSLAPHVTGDKDKSLSLSEELYRLVKSLDYLTHVSEYGG